MSDWKTRLLVRVISWLHKTAERIAREFQGV